MKILKGLCDRCRVPGRDKCTKLCPEAEAYADQDYLNQKELPIGRPRKDSDPFNLINRPHKPKQDLKDDFLSIVVQLSSLGYSQREISRMTGIAQRTICDWLSDFFPK